MIINIINIIIQVYAYINVLYSYVLEENEDTKFTLYNGAAESLNTLIGM